MSTTVIGSTMRSEPSGARFSRLPTVSPAVTLAVETERLGALRIQEEADRAANEAILLAERLAAAEAQRRLDVQREEERKASLFNITLVDQSGVRHTIQDVTAMTTVATLRQLVQDKTGVAENQQRLIFAGKQLDNDMTLESKKIGKDSVLHLVIRLTGGAN